MKESLKRPFRFLVNILAATLVVTLLPVANLLPISSASASGLTVSAASFTFPGTTGYQGGNVESAWSNDGSTVVAVWSELNNNPRKLFAAIGSISDGNLVWGTPTALASATSSNPTGKVAINSDGSVITVVWDDNEVSSSQRQTVRANTAVRDGETYTWGTATNLSTFSDRRCNSPDIKFDHSDSLALVTWRCNIDDGSKSKSSLTDADINARSIEAIAGTISAAGVAWGTATTIDTTTDIRNESDVLNSSITASYFPKVAVSSDGSLAAITWYVFKQNGAGTSDDDLVAAVTTASITGTTFTLDPAVELSSRETSNLVIASAGNSFVAAWNQLRASAINNEIATSNINFDDETPEWSAEFIPTAANTTGQFLSPGIATSRSGNRVILGWYLSVGATVTFQSTVGAFSESGLTWASVIRNVTSDSTGSAFRVGISNDGTRATAVYTVSAKITVAHAALSATDLVWGTSTQIDTMNGSNATLSMSASGANAVISWTRSNSPVFDAQPVPYVYLTATPAASDSSLSALSVSQGTLTPAFATGTTSYTVSVPNATSSTTVTATRNNSSATIQYRLNSGSYTSLTSGSASGSISLSVGSSNVIEVLVTAQDLTTTTYTITYTRAAPPSTDANLSALTVSQGTLSPDFAAATTTYTASVANSVSSVTINATKNDAGASIEYKLNSGSYASLTSGSDSPSISLSVGSSNVISVRVTAENGSTTKTYTITYTRAQSSDSSLSALSVSTGDLSPTFDAGTTSYTVSVSNTTSSVTITATKNQADATLAYRVNGGSYTSLTSGSASAAISLSVGSSNVIDVRVTAQDTTTTTYTITYTRAQSDDSTLSALSLSAGSLSPAFSGATTSYTVSTPSATSSVTVTATRNQSAATLEYKVDSGSFASLTSGSASGSISLTAGVTTTIVVKVTAEDGSTTEYTIEVTRSSGSNDETLSALSVSGGTLDGFASGTLSYSISVGFSVSTTTITATANDSGATLQYKVNSGSYTSLTSGSASGSISLSAGTTTTITILVTAEDGSTKEYVIEYTRAAGSSDNLLSGLSVSSGTLPTFSSSTFSYSINVLYAVSTTTITATANDSGATVAYKVDSGSFVDLTSGVASGSISLSTGTTTITIRVTAEDGTTLDYVIEYTRAGASTDSSLGGLTFAGITLVPAFASGTTSYTATSSYSTSSFTITATVNDATGSVEYRPGTSGAFTALTSGSASGSISLSVGDNTYQIRVTAEDGSTTTYTVVITRTAASTNSSLTALTFATGTTSPAFSSGTTAYTMTLPAGTTSITTTFSQGSSGSVEYRVGSSGSYSPLTSGITSIPLAVGVNQIYIRVTAEDGVTQTVYQITITVQAPPNEYRDDSDLPQTGPSTINIDDIRFSGNTPSDNTSNKPGNPFDITIQGLPANATLDGTTQLPSGISGIEIIGNKVRIIPSPSFSGKTEIEITIILNGNRVTIKVPITVNPAPVSDLQHAPTSNGRTLVNWANVPNATGYEILLNGQVVCRTLGTSCTLSNLVGPNAELVVVSRGGDGTRSAMTGSGYAPTDPVTVLTVFFNSRSSTVSASERRKLVRFAKEVAGQGFTTLTVLGHTDGRGEASTASRLAGQRNSAVLNILKKHTKIKFVQRNLGAKRPAESNATAAGQAKNRRVEIMLR